MATNHERVGAGLELLTKGLKPFVSREMHSRFGGNWGSVAAEARGMDIRKGADGKYLFDASALLGVMWTQWNEVFTTTLGPLERSLVSELRDWRNKWAHQEQFSNDDAYRALDSMERLLTAISAAEAEEVRKHKQAVLRTRYDDQRRQEQRRMATLSIETAPSAGLKPWREIATPHPDVTAGSFTQAEFAADLAQVARGEAADEYGDPTSFFGRTYLTAGLKWLLCEALRRMNGSDGQPVVELQTNFGGGKTHSMIALYHMFSGVPASDLPGIDAVTRETGIAALPKTRRAVLVGTQISPSEGSRKADGTWVRTLWGELAYQLGGAEGYALVRKADETGTSPGDALRQLLDKYAPCLILIDEWVAYARQLYHHNDLAGGTSGAHFTFAQALTEAARATPGVMVVASIPASTGEKLAEKQTDASTIYDPEIGGESGRRALESLRHVFGRMETAWKPATAQESFEIVRRRLFEPLVDDSLCAARDVVVDAFSRFYQKEKQEFPSGCREADYRRRMQDTYPIHPELFDRLYHDWSSLEKFQRTRGMLRLMASVIHALWVRDDKSAMIMPASVPIDDTAVQSELTRYLDDHWTPVIASDVDGEGSLPLRLDQENPNLGRYSATRRVARALYIGSAPTANNPNRGVEDRQIKLGCAQPGESPAVFGDALRRLAGSATFLYQEGQRYWYMTTPTVTKLARDRAEQLAPEDVDREIARRLRDATRSRGDFLRVHVCPDGAADVPDRQEAGLVVLGPQYAYDPKQGPEQCPMAREILAERGTGPRMYRNALVFLVADRGKLEELRQAVREYLAWTSIEKEADPLNLNAYQRKQAQTRQTGSNKTAEARVPETYCWLLAPTQATPDAEPTWERYRLAANSKDLVQRASEKLIGEGALTEQMGGTVLKCELDRVPLWRGNHVAVSQLMEDFAKYLYLPRLTGPEVLRAAVRDGVSGLAWETETFAYADGFDAESGRYCGLQAGRQLERPRWESALVVKAEVAAPQLAGPVAPEPVEPEPGTQPAGGGPRVTGGGVIEHRPKAPVRFYGSIKLDPVRLGADASRVADEIVRHLVGLLGSDVTITMDVSATVPDGIPDTVVRTVGENARTLGFDQQGFEEG